MDPLKMHTPDFSQENIAKLAALFPNCVTESLDDKGNLKKAIDFDQLRQELSDHIVEGPQERYHLNWPGKREALLLANAPIAKTLRPCREESVDFDTTQNLFIEGDNLDALKLLQENYLGKVKMIYIDPPYNTGNDFIYEDDFAENTDDFLKRSNQKDEMGNRMVANNESNGRFHSDWLSMIYARLRLARNLLKEDGVIFVSIDEKECSNLKKVADEVFGEANFESQIAWRRRHNQPNDKSKMIAKVSECILVYAKNSLDLKVKGTYYGLPLSEDRIAEYTNPDSDPRGPWSTNPWKAAVGRGGSKYEIVTPTGLVLNHTWYGNAESFRSLLADGRVHWTSGGNGVPRIKIYLEEAKRSGQAAINFFTHEKFGSNQDGSAELESLFSKEGLFDNPKPTKLISSIIKLASKDNDLVLDFFAGSGTISDAVFRLNAEDGGNRKFIMVQLPEACDEKSEACKAGYKTIAEISKERIRRAGKKILEGACHEGWNKDVGFRVLKVDSSNMAEVYYDPSATEQTLLSALEENIKKDRTDEDLLFQVMLDWGLQLTLSIKQETIAGNTVYFVDDNALVACFAKKGEIAEAFCKELALKKPLRVVFRDAGFADDAAKINVEQIFKLHSPNTDVKTL
jgi:adenine-specific DNA-methyltransferase